MTSYNSDNAKSEEMTHCGSKPKKIAIGIAPLGFISIGIVPMGIVTVGVVPMGVISLGIVAMGVVNASVVGMGVFSAGLTTMGIRVWSPSGPPIEKINKNIHSNESNNVYAYTSKARAEEEAKKFGCVGVHKMGKLWMPCATHGAIK